MPASANAPVLDSMFFLLFHNDLPWNIFRSLGSIYADNIIYGRTSKKVSRASQLISHQWDTELSSVIMNSSSLNETGTQVFSRPQVERACYPLLKIQVKWLACSIALGITRRHLLYFIFARVRLELKREYCCHIWAGATQSSLSTLDSIQNCMLSCRRGLFSTLQLIFPTGTMLQA